MTGRKLWLDWIDEKNAMQVRWAVRYLHNAGVALPNAPDPLTQLRGIHNQWLRQTAPADELAYTKIVHAMKPAWRKYANRNARTGIKSYSIEMNRSVSPALKRLSRDSGMPANQVLENLILNTEAFRQHLERRKKEEVAKIRPPRQGTDRFAERQKHQLAALKQTALEWETTVDNLLIQGAQHQVALKAMGLWDDTQPLRLKTEQEVAANKLAQRWKAVLTKSVKAKLGVANLMLRDLGKAADE